MKYTKTIRASKNVRPATRRPVRASRAALRGKSIKADEEFEDIDMPAEDIDMPADGGAEVNVDDAATELLFEADDADEGVIFLTDDRAVIAVHVAVEEQLARFEVERVAFAHHFEWATLLGDFKERGQIVAVERAKQQAFRFDFGRGTENVEDKGLFLGIGTRGRMQTLHPDHLVADLFGADFDEGVNRVAVGTVEIAVFVFAVHIGAADGADMRIGPGVAA